MSTARRVMGFLFPLVFLQQPAAPTGKPKPICSPPENLSIVYEHAKFARKRRFGGHSGASKSVSIPTMTTTGIRVAQEIRRWEPPGGDRDEDEAWCLDTMKPRPKWFTDDDLFDAGLAPNDDSYRGSGFDRGHLAMKLLVERLGQDAAYAPTRY